MKHALSIFFLPISVSAMLLSCGTGKKLDAANAEAQRANAEVQRLQTANNQMVAQQNVMQKQVIGISDSIISVTQRYSQVKGQYETTTRRLQGMQAAEQEDEAALAAMAKKIHTAVADFNDKGIEVYQKDRLIYINMEDNLLYKSGSAVLGEEGKKALGNLASALNEYPDLKVVVVGHTDDKKFKNDDNDNLSLSTERANSVVRVLRDNYQVNPVRLTAAGKGKYDPVANNTTEEGRAKNRRTEIILRPDLVRLYESVRK